MSDSDSWETPQELFDELDEEFHFITDLCATEENSKCPVFGANYLKNEYVALCFDYASPNYFSSLRDVEEEFIGGAHFMNPPYSNPKPFIEKAWEDSKHCKIVCLVKCDPSTKWWATFWDHQIFKKCENCRGKGFTNLAYLGTPKKYCGYCKGVGKVSHSGPKPGCEVRFFPKRIKFVAPGGFEGRQSGPSFASALIIMDRRGIK